MNGVKVFEVLMSDDVTLEQVDRVRCVIVLLQGVHKVFSLRAGESFTSSVATDVERHRCHKHLVQALSAIDNGIS